MPKGIYPRNNKFNPFTDSHGRSWFFTGKLTRYPGQEFANRAYKPVDGYFDTDERSVVAEYNTKARKAKDD